MSAQERKMPSILKTGLAFPFSLAMMSHVMYLQKQSAAAKWIITGGTMTFLIVVSLLATVFL
jgi:hypothetical protein